MLMYTNPRSIFSPDIANSSWYILYNANTRWSEWVWCVDRMLLMVKPKHSEKNLAQCYCLYHRSHMDWSGIEWRPLHWEADDWPPKPWPGVRVSLMLMHWILYGIVGSLKVCTSSYCIANHVVHPLLQEDQLRKLQTLFQSSQMI